MGEGGYSCYVEEEKWRERVVQGDRGRVVVDGSRERDEGGREAAGSVWRREVE